jgi:hypothetical protein
LNVVYIFKLTWIYYFFCNPAKLSSFNFKHHCSRCLWTLRSLRVSRGISSWWL